MICNAFANHGFMFQEENCRLQTGSDQIHTGNSEYLEHVCDLISDMPVAVHKRNHFGLTGHPRLIPRVTFILGVRPEFNDIELYISEENILIIEQKFFPNPNSSSVRNKKSCSIESKALK